MKFSDFFLPKIARSDPEVRKTAIREEIDVELLRQVAVKDADRGVREVAKERISELVGETEPA